jgi:hypothetical protein
MFTKNRGEMKMFDPKKIMDSAVDQVQKQATGMATGRTSGRTSGGSEIDELIYRMTRDMEDLRRKNQELSDRLNDFERQFNHLRDLINRNNRY